MYVNIKYIGEQKKNQQKFEWIKQKKNLINNRNYDNSKQKGRKTQHNQIQIQVHYFRC